MNLAARVPDLHRDRLDRRTARWRSTSARSSRVRRPRQPVSRRPTGSSRSTASNTTSSTGRRPDARSRTSGRKAGQTVTLGIMRPDGTVADVVVTLRPPDVAAEQGALGVVFEDGRPVSFLDRTFTRGPGRGPRDRGPTNRRGIRPDPRRVSASSAHRSSTTRRSRRRSPDRSASPAAGRRLLAGGHRPDAVLRGDPVGQPRAREHPAVPAARRRPDADDGRSRPSPGRRISLRAERLTYLVGFAFLFAFLIWVTTSTSPGSLT